MEEPGGGGGGGREADRGCTTNNKNPTQRCWGKNSETCRKKTGTRISLDPIPTVSGHFWTFRCRFVWQAGIPHRVKNEEKGRVLSYCGMSKNGGKRRTFEEDLQRSMLCGRGSTRDMFIRDVRRTALIF